MDLRSAIVGRSHRVRTRVKREEGAGWASWCVFFLALLFIAPACRSDRPSSGPLQGDAAPARRDGAGNAADGGGDDGSVSEPAGVEPSAEELAALEALFEASWQPTDYARLITEVYAARESAHLFVGPEELSLAGAALMTFVESMEDHGLDPRAVNRPSLVSTHRAFELAVEQATDQVQPLRARLEVALAGALAYIVDHLGALLTLDEEAAISWAKYRWRERTIRFVEIFDAARTRDMAAYLRSLAPEDDSYKALQAGLKRYRSLSAGEEFPTAPKVGRKRWLEPGKKGRKVAALTKRLAAEGFYAGEPKASYDEQVETAVKAFQRAHGMEQDGVVGPGTARRMKRGASSKLLQLRVAMRRVREAPHRGESSYVLVNIPAYELVVVEAGEVALRLGVIVGDEKEVEDEDTGEKSRPNATRVFSALVRYLVWNPRWQVPDRIKAEELDYNLLDDPNWYARNGYEIYRDQAGRERVLQLPGPDNSLGRVKILFPNPYNIYLHDTPKRRLFNRRRRAYSHGCMRLEQPLKLARHLLEKGNQWDEVEVTRLLEEPAVSEEHPEGLYERKWVVLKRPLPIHVEYQTVIDDGDGGVVFLEDLYAYDEPYSERLAGEDRRLTRAFR